jgi:hypothetical protein
MVVDSRGDLEPYRSCLIARNGSGRRDLLEPYWSCCYHKIVVDSRAVLEPC